MSERQGKSKKRDNGAGDSVYPGSSGQQSWTSSSTEKQQQTEGGSSTKQKRRREGSSSTEQKQQQAVGGSSAKQKRRGKGSSSAEQKPQQAVGGSSTEQKQPQAASGSSAEQRQQQTVVGSSTEQKQPQAVGGSSAKQKRREKGRLSTEEKQQQAVGGSSTEQKQPQAASSSSAEQQTVVGSSTEQKQPQAVGGSSAKQKRRGKGRLSTEEKQQQAVGGSSIEQKQQQAAASSSSAEQRQQQAVGGSSTEQKQPQAAASSSSAEQRQQLQRTDTGKGPEKKPKSAKLQEMVFARRITAIKKSGTPIRVATNFFPLIIKDSNIIVHHYDVVIEPKPPKYLLRAIWNKYLSLMFPGYLTAFDGKNAYSRKPLIREGSTSATFTLFNIERDREKEFSVSIVEVRKISLSCFQNYTERVIKSQSMKTLPEAELAIVDIILRNWASDNLVISGSRFFPYSALAESAELSKKLSLRIGYFQSAFLGYSPYLNFDIAYQAFYNCCHLLDIADGFKNRHTGALSIEEMNHFIRNCKIEYQLPNNSSPKLIFRVNKLVNDANVQTFTKEDGTKLSVAQYFEREKKCKLRFPWLPLLWVGPTQKSIYLPMEFCRIAPDQPYKGSLDFFEIRAMTQKATSNARLRKAKVCSLFQKININSHPLMREFGFEVASEMEKIPARVLAPPSLRTSRNIRVENGVWRIQDFLSPVCLRKWCILNLDNRVSKQSLMNFQQMLKIKGIEYKMQIADPVREPLDGDPSFVGMKRAFSHLKDMDMVFVVISDAKGVYSRVKAICETQEGVLTQCVRSKTLSQEQRNFTSTVQNILLKVNAKLGGKNHCLDWSSIPECLNGYVMVAGADVTHPSPGMKIPSVAAVTVSCDPVAFQYATTTRVQPKGEMIKDLEEMMSVHLKNFYQIRKKYPEKIIFFRDGVSEGELSKVLREEIYALRKACKGYCQPKITFIVVQKRHHAKFYPTCAADEQGKNFNVPVGTCVDSEIVHPRDLDFYLVSHATLLGTVRPTRYRLLHDDNELTDEEVETLSYYLCHLFSRCNRSVSYPSPTYNAHLAAARVRAHLEGLNLMQGQDIDVIKNKMPDYISRISPMYFV